MPENLNAQMTAHAYLKRMRPKERAKYWRGLREFLHWLYGKRDEIDNQHRLAAFEAAINDLDSVLEKRVISGEISEAQADFQRGKFVWERAVEEARVASRVMASQVIARAKMRAILEGSVFEETESETTLHDKYEGEIIEKLEQSLDVGEA